MKASLRKCFVSRQSSERASKNPARRADERESRVRNGTRKNNEERRRWTMELTFRISYLRANFGEMRNDDGGQTSLAKKEHGNVII
jgi:hypothetical protein